MLHDDNRHQQLYIDAGNSARLLGSSVPATLALTELLKAFDYAQSSQREIWDFAVEIRTLRDAGMTDADFRWLAYLGYVDHAREVTVFGDDRRRFQCTGMLSFAQRTCFVLTTSGADFARSLMNGSTTNSRLQPPPGQKLEIPLDETVRPVWHAERRELRFDGALVKQFKSPAANQEVILAAFHEEDWPPRIDDPLPPHSEQDSKRRLRDTIKCLNRKQKNQLLHFRSDGTGEGVIWELVAHSAMNAKQGG